MAKCGCGNSSSGKSGGTAKYSGRAASGYAKMGGAYGTPASPAKSYSPTDRYMPAYSGARGGCNKLSDALARYTKMEPFRARLAESDTFHGMDAFDRASIQSRPMMRPPYAMSEIGEQEELRRKRKYRMH